MSLTPLSYLRCLDSELTIIAALTETTRVIGCRGRLPWNLPEDLQRFKELTIGHPIIMGRKTWEFGLRKRTLPHRHNIVLSRSRLSASRLSASRLPASRLSGCDGGQSPAEVDTSLQGVRSLSSALKLAQELSPISASPTDRIFIIGGASIYAQTLALAHRLELTLVHDDVEGDTFFPPYEHLLNEFDCVMKRYQPHTTPASTYLTYQRRALTTGDRH